MKSFKASFGLLFLLTLLFVSFPANGQVTDQREIRPDMVFMHRQYSSGVDLLMGNTSDSRMELMITSSRNFREMTSLRGNPNITLDNSTIGLDGEVSGVHAQGFRTVQSFYQRNEYFSDMPVDRRVQSQDGDRIMANITMDFDRIFEIPQTFDELVNNDQFVKHNSDRRDLTAFISRTGEVISVPINDTSGEEIGRIVGFHLSLVIFVFKTSSEQFVGVHRVTEKGHGNLIPEGYRTQLRNSTFDRDTRNARGSEQLQHDRSEIPWISVGFNETLGLDMYRALFHHEKEATSFFIRPTSISTLSLNQVPLGIEEFVLNLEISNTLSEIEEEELQDLDADYADQVVESTTNDFDPLPQLSIDKDIIFVAEIIALVGLTIILVQRFRRKQD